MIPVDRFGRAEANARERNERYDQRRLEDTDSTLFSVSRLPTRAQGLVLLCRLEKRSSNLRGLTGGLKRNPGTRRSAACADLSCSSVFHALGDHADSQAPHMVMTAATIATFCRRGGEVAQEGAVDLERGRR